MSLSIELPGGDALVRKALAERLERAGRNGLERDRLVKELSSDWPVPVLEAALAALEAGGDAVEWNRRWISRRLTDFRYGTVQTLERGDALLRSGERSEAAYFVRRRDLKTARDGDEVLFKPSGGDRRRRQTDLPPATVVKVLARGRRTVVGTLELGEGGRWLLPFDPKASLDLLVETEDEPLEDEYVVAGIDDRGAPAGAPLRGEVLERLGRAEVPGVDVKVILRHFEIPEEFPSAVLEAATVFGQDPGPEDRRDREDLTGEICVTIDGETARDFDDAISVETRPEGGFRLGVHIADVSHYVEEGGVLDLEAYRRGTSVYFPDRAVPMLPESLSNGLCSLRPEVPRLTVSAFLDVAPDGEILRRRFATTVIRSRRRLTYAEVRRVLDEPEAEDEKRYGEVLALLHRARDLMRILHRTRDDRGSIDFDLPQGDVILDTDGVTVGVRPGERNVAHRIIEELMIAANEAVAAELEGHAAPALYRVHDSPRAQELGELKEVLRSLGIALKGDLADLHPSALQRVLQRVEGSPEEPFVSTLVLRSMQRALYETASHGHYALAARHYTHFTSPIRRYPDLLVHRQLKSILPGGDKRGAERTLLTERLPAIAERCSFTERRAERAERMILNWKLVRLLAGRVGETFAGRITGVQPFGLFVQLVDYYVDGLVPIRNLTDDFYVFDQESHRLVGSQGGRKFRLADPVDVVLTGVDQRRRGLNLAISGIPKAEPRDRSGRTGRRAGRR